MNPLAIIQPAVQATTAATTAGAGLTAAGASKGLMQALLGSPKGIAALGQGVGMLGKVAGMMIGGKKGAKIAQSAGMFGLVAGLAPSLSGMFKSAPRTGTPTDNELPGSLTDTETALGKATEAAIGPYNNTTTPLQELGINKNWMKEDAPFYSFP